MEITEADLAACENADSFLQSSMWASFKEKFGWTAKAFLADWLEDGTNEKTPLLVLCRQLAPGFSFAYIPWGPKLPASITASDRVKIAAELGKKLRALLARNTVFIRFEPPWFYREKESGIENEASLFKTFGFKRAAAAVQPPDTVIINLEKTNNEILMQMKPKWRYNISLAEKKGIIVKTCTGREIETFYNLLKETAARDGISIHGINYYRTLFEICNNDMTGGNNKTGMMQLKLYIASHASDTLAAIAVLFRGKDAVYLYGASSNIKRNLMAPYALQWKAMQDAKEAGCLFYDLFGIPPNEDPNHPMAGLFRFKTGFGGHIIHRPGSWDYPCKKVFYNLFRIAEGLRKKIMNYKKKNRR
ncbi:MAG: peptidoglycan bridge formation glycyltransferase FemA/FemB family protein [Treponema sp.]|nr:peptidoglycan bridge formation glycyltransferase FemA/FemB family protein [Treponema sp.]